MKVDAPLGSDALVAPGAVPQPWSRRLWLSHHAATLGLAVLAPWRRAGRRPLFSSATADRLAAQGERHDPVPWQTLAQAAVDAARRAGAQYADARLTRTVQHFYGFDALYHYFGGDQELLGIGIRVLVNGYWGFAACPKGDAVAVERLAQDAVAQARANTIGPARHVVMGSYPVVTGSWTTPVRIDPFTISIEEKCDYIAYWLEWAQRCGGHIHVLGSHLHFVRQERVVATSDGSCFTQTLYESDGQIEVYNDIPQPRGGFVVDGLETAGHGWELVLDAQIPTQIETKLHQIQAELRAHPVPPKEVPPQQLEVGRYTVVCDGATMASLLEQTLGLATQLDRALGYEADAGGTSFIDDPLAMVGHLPIASPLVTVTANRDAVAQLATVKWDDEGVVPQPFTIVKDGVLMDFQTTREQVTWLTAYYQQHGQPVQSHGCAAAESGLYVSLQQMPNLALIPNPASVGLADLIADVKEGILIERGDARVDFQARNGFVWGAMHKITNGRIGVALSDGALRFNTLDLWKNVVAVGGEKTQALLSTSQYANGALFGANVMNGWKGQPPQTTSHTVSAVAATIRNQAVLDPYRKA